MTPLHNKPVSLTFREWQRTVHKASERKDLPNLILCKPQETLAKLALTKGLTVETSALESLYGCQITFSCQLY